MHLLVVDLANQFLAPYTNRIQLHLTEVIKIQPGQGSLSLDRDCLAWGGYGLRKTSSCPVRLL